MSKRCILEVQLAKQKFEYIRMKTYFSGVEKHAFPHLGTLLHIKIQAIGV
jgi:hypothetical protein